ncbi:hypothetical protein DPMN_061881 [Dreissena polymorpha]|uniref:Uncharacterized protein n=1 Tax=Dreissena polymorpha TaxID=45954 RepID=A0A9D4C8P2_DREPO|nr:hypothetical protein DPMN_061881 [Dreissena polymorpha]
MVQAEVPLAEEEDRGIRAVAISCQGAWTKWQNTGKKIGAANLYALVSCSGQSTICYLTQQTCPDGKKMTTQPAIFVER